MLVTSNTGSATGTSGFAEGGGIWNGQPFGSDGAPTPSLLIDNTAVHGNTLTASPGSPCRAAASSRPASRSHPHNSLIARNAPDQCFGC